MSQNPTIEQQYNIHKRLKIANGEKVLPFEQFKHNLDLNKSLKDTKPLGIKTNQPIPGTVPKTGVKNKVSDEKVSEILKSMPQYVMVKDKIGLGSVNSQPALEKIEAEFTDAKSDKTDG